MEQKAFHMDRTLKTTFDKVAKEYDSVRPTYPESCIDDIVDYSQISEKSKILEIGCGTGQATQFFLNRSFSVDCLDIGQELIDVARVKFKNDPRVTFEPWTVRSKRLNQAIFFIRFRLSEDLGKWISHQKNT